MSNDPTDKTDVSPTPGGLLTEEQSARFVDYAAECMKEQHEQLLERTAQLLPESWPERVRDDVMAQLRDPNSTLATLWNAGCQLEEGSVFEVKELEDALKTWKTICTLLMQHTDLSVFEVASKALEMPQEASLQHDLERSVSVIRARGQDSDATAVAKVSRSNAAQRVFQMAYGPEDEPSENLQKDVKTWKTLCALAMEYAGVTTMAFSHERLREVRWGVRLSRDIHSGRSIVTIEHLADASEAEPRYMFTLENGRLPAKHLDRIERMIRRWIRSNFRDKVGVIELPHGTKLHIQKMVGGGELVDVDPHKIGIRVMHVDCGKGDDRSVGSSLTPLLRDHRCIERAIVLCIALEGDTSFGPDKILKLDVQPLYSTRRIRLTTSGTQEMFETLKSYVKLGAIPSHPRICCVEYDNNTKRLLTIMDAKEPPLSYDVHHVHPPRDEE